MNLKLLAFCVGCSLVFATTSLADEPEPEETPAILSALGTQVGVAVVSEAELAEIEGTAWLPRWQQAFRARISAYLRASRAARLRMWRARMAYFWALNGGGGGGGGAEVPEGGGDDVMPPE